MSGLRRRIKALESSKGGVTRIIILDSNGRATLGMESFDMDDLQPNDVVVEMFARKLPGDV